MSSMVDIVIPVHNEGENIKLALSEIHSKTDINFNINIVYDFDEDDTIEPAIKTSQKLGFKIDFLKNIYGRGVSGAIRTGLEATSAPYVIVTMADLSDPAQVMNEMYRKAVEDGADLVCATRYSCGGRQIGGPFVKKILSRLAGLSLNFLTGIPTHDITNSFKLYSRKVLKAVTIESRLGFELGMELTLKAYFMGFKIAEVPTVWHDRRHGKSRFKVLKWLPAYLKWYFFAIRKAFFSKKQE